MFKKIMAWFSKVFSSTIAFIKPKAEIAVKVVNVIKEIVESPIVGAIVNYTKTGVDDKILARVKEILNVIAPKLIVAQILQENKTNSEIILDLIDYLKSQNSKIRTSVYVMLAAELTKALADGKITTGEAISISQIVYEEIQSNKAAA